MPSGCITKNGQRERREQVFFLSTSYPAADDDLCLLLAQFNTLDINPGGGGTTDYIGLISVNQMERCSVTI